jgi:hypothetical protein
MCGSASCPERWAASWARSIGCCSFACLNHRFLPYGARLRGSDQSRDLSTGPDRGPWLSSKFVSSGLGPPGGLGVSS